jgi:Ca2+-dependent lipid-binding protein
VNGLSDPYVVLTNENGKRIAKTRTIWGDLNPRWEESFDVPTTASLWLAATVWDRDKLVKNHDLVGRCYVKLDPGFFGDYLPRV